MKLVIDITEEDYIRSFLAILSVGVIQCIKEKGITVRQSENLFFFPGMIHYLENEFPEMSKIVHEGTELDQIERIYPEIFIKCMDSIKEKSINQISFKNFWTHIDYTLENE